MATPLDRKSTPEQIRERFDRYVDVFSDLETGQRTAIDAPLMMELITRAALAATPGARRVLDIGCGAGNNTLKLLQLRPALDCDLIDLSGPMVERARERVSAATSGQVRTFQGDFREVELEAGRYDVIVAAAVFHHLRDEADWERTFEKVFDLLAPGGSFWVSDLVSHAGDGVQALMWERYGEFLTGVRGEAFRDTVFGYIDEEDSPRPVTWQLELMRRTGFTDIDLLHKNSVFAAFGGLKQKA